MNKDLMSVIITQELLPQYRSNRYIIQLVNCATFIEEITFFSMILPAL